MCDGSVEWASKRALKKRRDDERADAAQQAPVDQAEVAARFAQAGADDSVPLSAQQEEERSNREQQARLATPRHPTRRPLHCAT